MNELATRLGALYDKADALTPGEKLAIGPALVGHVLDRSAMDGLFWLKWVSTRDEADPHQSVKPFPIHLPYVRAFWKVMEDNQRVVLAKSRQMLVSWTVCAFCCWIARFRPNQAVFWQSQQYEDAAMMIAMPEGGYRGRCQFIEETLESWMRLPIKCSEGRIQYPNGSLIQAVAGGANKVRGKVVSLYVGDEFAHQEDQAGVYSAVGPLMQKGARAIFVSTPNGSDNFFATLWHGRPVGAVKP